MMKLCEKYGKNQGRIQSIPSLVICPIWVVLSVYRFLYIYLQNDNFIMVTLCHLVKQRIKDPGLVVIIQL